MVDTHSRTLAGKNAIVVGGGKNLGGLISTLLAQAGASVVITYNSQSSAAETNATVEKIVVNGGKALAIQANLTQKGEIPKIFAEAVKQIGGKFDIAINTAGKVLKKPIAEISEDEYDSMFAINTKLAFFFIQQAAANLNDGGKIISIVTSLLGAFTGYYASYQGSKAPVEWFTKAAAKEYMPRGIKVNAIAPGPMDTPFFYPQESTEAVEYHKSQALNGRLTDIKDIAPLVLFLVETDNWITGQTIFSNGGYTTR